MVKKLQKMAEKKSAAASGLLDSQLAQTVKDSAQQIWLAGLGAFSKAQAEGGKAGATDQQSDPQHGIVAAAGLPEQREDHRRRGARQLSQRRHRRHAVRHL